MIEPLENKVNFEMFSHLKYMPHIQFLPRGFDFEKLIYQYDYCASLYLCRARYCGIPDFFFMKCEQTSP